MDAIVYPHSANTDKKRLFACYSILEQMRVERNKQAPILRERLSLEPVPIDPDEYKAKRKAGFIKDWCSEGYMIAGSGSSLS